MYPPRGGVPCGLLHLIFRFPFLVVPIALGVILALPHLNSIPQRCVPEAMITFCFDDGYSSTFSAFKLLEKYGFPGTLFVVTSFVGQPGYLNVEQILTLAEHGWEIGSHTVTHADNTQLTVDELLVSKQYLESLGLTVKSFASHFHYYDEEVMQLIRQYYFAHRSYVPGLNSILLEKPEDRYYLKAIVVKSTTTVQEVKEWMIKAKNEKKWLILVFHRIDESGEENWSSENFEKVLQFAIELGFKGIKISAP